MSINMKNKLFIAALVVLTVVAAWFRLYRHHDFLHFELDQARDTMVISDAVKNGIGELPLLGPRAAGTLLRLGPLFYYFLYLFARLFGEYPDKTALFDAVLSIATVPLLYLFLRLYFSRSISLATTAVAAVSLFAITYGRFSWNPNTLPFFTLGLLYALTQCFRLAKHKRIRYIYLAAACFGAAVQMHFLAYLALPLVIVSFLVVNIFEKSLTDGKGRNIFLRLGTGIRAYKWNELPWKHFGGAILVVLFLGLPVMINETLTGGDNAKELIKAFTSKSEKGEPHNIAENAFRNTEEYARGYFLILSGIQKGELFEKTEFKSNLKIIFKCDNDCVSALPYTMAGLIFFAAGFWLMLIEIIRSWKKRETDPTSRNNLRFLSLVSLLFGVTFIGFTPFAYQFAPRFLLVTFPVPFVLLALILSFFARRAIFGGLAAALIIAVLLGTNSLANYERFQELAAATDDNPIYFQKDIVLKEDYRFTLLQQEMITDWIKSQSARESVFVWAPPKYYRPLIYLLRQYQGLDAQRGGYKAPCLEADYFAVVPSRSSSAFFAKGGEVFGSVGVKQFGTLTVHKLEIKDEAKITQQKCPSVSSESEPNYARRYKFNEIFNSP